MKSKISPVVLLVVLLFVFSISVSAEDPGLKPILVSPGITGSTLSIEQSCPTFSWTSVNWAIGYEVVVFKTDSDSLFSYEDISAYEKPIMIKEIRGQASSWTPASIERLNNGATYFWYVKAIDQGGNGTWSDGKTFSIELPIMLAQVEEQIREKLKKEGMSDESINNVFSGVGSDRKGTEDLSKSNDVPGGVTGTEGTYNTFYGTNAGNGTMTGQYNSFFGAGAGAGNTTGEGNTFSGYQAGYYNTTGSYNTFSGFYAGRNNTTGMRNTFSGLYAGISNTTGYRNTFSGYKAGDSNTTGMRNTFSGHQAGGSNTTGSYNTFSGNDAGFLNTTGFDNTFSGHQAGLSNTTGFDNTFSGYQAGYSNSTGNYNVFLGYKAGYYETGSNKLYIDNSDTSSPLIYGDFSTNILRVNGNLQATGYLSLNAGTNQITAAELNILDGKTLATGIANNDQLVTKGYVDENDSVGVGLTGSAMTDKYICKWDDGNTRLVDSLISEGTGTIGINGRLGIGTSTPAQKVEIKTTGELAVFQVTRTDGATFKLAAGVANTQIGTVSNHGVKFTTNNTWKMRLNASGTLDMADGGSYNGTWNDASSIEFKENIREMSSDEAKYALEELNPVIYNYKKYKDEDRVGFIAEHVPEIVANNNRKNLSAMDIVAVLTKVVKEQQRSMSEQLKINKERQKKFEEQQETIKQLKIEQQKAIIELQKEINELKKDRK